jgi:hypothetical protein
MVVPSWCCLWHRHEAICTAICASWLRRRFDFLGLIALVASAEHHYQTDSILVHIKAEPRAPIDSPFRETTTKAFQARAVASSHTRYRCGRFRSG